MTARNATTPATSRKIFTHGIVGGVIAGIIFAMAEMLGGRFVLDNPLFMPLKMIASVPLGDKPGTIGLETAIPVGLVTHLFFSALFGLVFALVAENIAALRRSALAMAASASVYGTLLWLVNFYVIAPALGRNWFTTTSAPAQFIFHTFFFGTVLGLYLASALPAAEPGERRATRERSPAT